MNRPSRLILFTALVLSPLTVTLSGRAAEPPPNIIFDTDMGPDCDDVGALFILHGAVERGEAKLLATMGCVSSEAIAPAIDGINTWFGRPEIPVGTLKDPGLLPGPHYTAELAAEYPHKFPASKNYPDAVTLYRQVLAKQPDGSVVVVAVGPLRNLANLLKSRPDAVSPLDGTALVAKKVKRLDVMGGKYPPFADAKDGEWNFKQDPAAAALVCSTWPTPVLFNGEGGSTNSGRRVTYEMPEHNPLTMAYALSAGVGFAGDRLSWDPVSCLVTVRGAAPWYKVVSGGVNVTDPITGINTWQAGANRGHSYLVLDQKRPKAEVEKALEDMMVAGKGRPTNLTFNSAYYASDGMCLITSRPQDATAVPIKAFDHDDKTAWEDRTASSWIQCQYVDARKYRVTSYVVVCKDPNRLPRTLELSGSNDGGISWTSLDTQVVPGFTERAARREFSIAKPAKWNIYRLKVTAANENEGIQISTIELNEAISHRPKVAVKSVTLDRRALTLSANTRATLNATIMPLQTSEREVAWVSSNPAVAEVRRIGEQIAILVGKKPGTCTVTATVGTLKRTCAVTVTPTQLPSGWSYDELNAPPIPGAVSVAGGQFILTGSGHAMTSWWERVRDQGIFASRAVIGDIELSARLTSLTPNVGGPNYPRQNMPPTASGLMIRESLTEKHGRYFLLQVEASGNLEIRWRDKTSDQDDNQEKQLGKVTLPIHLKLVQTGKEIQVFTSDDGQNWGQPRMSHTASFDEKSRIGLFVCSGNTFSSTTATFDSVALSNTPLGANGVDPFK